MIFRGENIPWDMVFDANEASFEPWRKTPKLAPPQLPADLAALTADDEHAL